MWYQTTFQEEKVDDHAIPVHLNPPLIYTSTKALGEAFQLFELINEHHLTPSTFIKVFTKW